MRISSEAFPFLSGRTKAAVSKANEFSKYGGSTLFLSTDLQDGERDDIGLDSTVDFICILCEDMVYRMIEETSYKYYVVNGIRLDTSKLKNKDCDIFFTFQERAFDGKF